MMVFPRTLTACLLLAAAPVFADGHGLVTPVELDENVTPEERLKAAANANPDLEWRDGAEGEADSMVMLSDVLFDFGTSRLSQDAIDVLSTMAAELPDISALEIVGHTDNIGAEDDNIALAEARALAVKTWFVVNSPIYPDTMSVVGKGEAEPVAQNQLENGVDNPEGRARNRRVEFFLPKQKDSETAQSS